jgi:hypothetical protein
MEKGGYLRQKDEKRLKKFAAEQMVTRVKIGQAFAGINRLRGIVVPF